MEKDAEMGQPHPAPGGSAPADRGHRGGRLSRDWRRAAVLCDGGHGIYAQPDAARPWLYGIWKQVGQRPL